MFVNTKKQPKRPLQPCTWNHDMKLYAFQLLLEVLQ